MKDEAECPDEEVSWDECWAGESARVEEGEGEERGGGEGGQMGEYAGETGADEGGGVVAFGDGMSP